MRTLIINTRKHTDTRKKSSTMRACTEKRHTKNRIEAKRRKRRSQRRKKTTLYIQIQYANNHVPIFFGVYTLVDWPNTTQHTHGTFYIFGVGPTTQTRVWPSECKSQPLAKCKQGSLIGIVGTDNDDADRCRSKHCLVHCREN